MLCLLVKLARAALCREVFRTVFMRSIESCESVAGALAALRKSLAGKCS